MALTLRRMRGGEEPRLYEVLRSAVIRGAVAHYDEAQRRAWAPDRPPEGRAQRLGRAECFVAVTGALIVGFIAVTPVGHVDLVYVLPERHGAGSGSSCSRGSRRRCGSPASRGGRPRQALSPNRSSPAAVGAATERRRWSGMARSCAESGCPSRWRSDVRGVGQASLRKVYGTGLASLPLPREVRLPLPELCGR